MHAQKWQIKKSKRSLKQSVKAYSLKTSKENSLQNCPLIFFMELELAIVTPIPIFWEVNPFTTKDNICHMLYGDSATLLQTIDKTPKHAPTPFLFSNTYG